MHESMGTELWGSLPINSSLMLLPTSPSGKPKNQTNQTNKKTSKTSQNNFEPVCGKKGSWEKGERGREPASTKSHLQIILNTVHKLCRRHSLDITIPETWFALAVIVFPPLISHLREVLFILVTQITQHVRNRQFCSLQVWGGVGFPTWLGISILKSLVHYFLLSLSVTIES